MSRRPGTLTGLRAALLASVSAGVLASAACGGRGDPSGASDPRIRVLDPAGRLFAAGSVTVLHRGRWGTTWGRIASGDRSGVFDLGENRSGELMVFARGCRTETTEVSPSGDTIVRLRRGLPVRLRVRWDGVVPAGYLEMGVSLEAPPPPVDGDRPRGLLSVEASAFDEDTATKPDWTRLSGKDPLVLLCVPEPGEYRVNWRLDAKNRGLGFNGAGTVTVGPTGVPGEAEVEPPLEAMRGSPVIEGRAPLPVGPLK